jgi:hypothetical protein
VIAEAAVALALVAGVAPATFPPALPGEAYPARVQVVAREFALSLSRTRIRSGPALVELVNFGEDDHDLRLRRLGRGWTRAWRTPKVLPGERYLLETSLRPGRYRLWCSLADHRERGMEATLTVLPAS